MDSHLVSLSFGEGGGKLIYGRGFFVLLLLWGETGGMEGVCIYAGEQVRSVSVCAVRASRFRGSGVLYGKVDCRFLSSISQKLPT